MRIMILGFGGTIAMVPDAHGVLKPAKSISDILGQLPELGQVADFDFEELENRDSTNINPNHWVKLASRIASLDGLVDGILVTHGTDTMAYTSSAVSMALGRGLKMPVVFTGSQLPLVSFGTDARFNLENAVKVLGEAVRLNVAEVVIVFGDNVYRANRTIKSSEAKFAAFSSPALAPLATIDAVGVHFSSEARRIDRSVELQPRYNFHKGILAIDLVPGLNPDILKSLVDSGLCAGLLLKSLGAGNVPSEDEYNLVPVIRYAIEERQIPVLVSTKFVGGNTHMDIYEPGKLALDAGAIPTGDLTDVMAQIKFMWALGQGITNPDLKAFMLENVVGEITA
jgi:L-asparaginase